MASTDYFLKNAGGRVRPIGAKCLNPLLLVLLLVLVLGLAGFFPDEDEEEDEPTFGCKLVPTGVIGLAS